MRGAGPRGARGAPGRRANPTKRRLRAIRRWRIRRAAGPRGERPQRPPRAALLRPAVLRAARPHEYALEALASDREARATRQAHATYYLALVEQAEPELTGPQQRGWFAQLEQEQDNLRAALSWLLEPGSDGQSNELALRFAGALSQFWGTRGHVSEGRRWLERVLTASSGVRSDARAQALVGAGRLAKLQDAFAQAEALCEAGWALYQELGNRRGSAAALARWGYAAMMRSHHAQARAA